MMECSYGSPRCEVSVDLQLKLTLEDVKQLMHEMGDNDKPTKAGREFREVLGCLHLSLTEAQ